MHARPLLYTYRRCPYAMRARMALLTAGIGFDAYEIVLRNKPPGLLAASPKGTVPVLVLPDGAVLEQSWDIVQWALTQPNAPAATQDWWPRAQTAANRELLDNNDGAFKHHLDRYKYPQRYVATEGEDVAEARAHHRARAQEVLLNPLEMRLNRDAFLGGDQPCATDIGIFPFVRQFAAVDPAWFAALPLPHTQAWLARWVHTALFEACMQKHPAGLPSGHGDGRSI